MSTPMENMIAMSRGAQRGRAALAEDSPLEAPVGGFNRHMSLMAPATREMVLKSRSLDIEKFAESRQLNAGAVLGIAEAAMRLGRVPDLRQYGFSGDDAKAIKHFIAGDVLNIAIEQLDAMDTINEAMSDRESSKAIRALTQDGASRILGEGKKCSTPGGRAYRKMKAAAAKKKPAVPTFKKYAKKAEEISGYLKGLNALAEGNLLVIRNMLGEHSVALGAAHALIDSMSESSAETKQQVQAEATSTAQVASYMNLSSNMAHARPRTMVNAERATRIEDEKTAMKIGPRLGASPFETDVLTLEGIAAKAREADLEAAAAMEAADDIQSPTAVSPKGEKVKTKGAKKLRSAGEYEKGQFHPGSHGTAEAVEESKKPSAKKLRSATEYVPGQFHPGSHGTAEAETEALADVIINENESLSDVIHECFNEAESYDQFFQLVEKYVGFKKLTKEIAAKGGASDPKAVAAAIGRKKYGKKAFQKAASAGKKMKGVKSEEQAEIDDQTLLDLYAEAKTEDQFFQLVEEHVGFSLLDEDKQKIKKALSRMKDVGYSKAARKTAKGAMKAHAEKATKPGQKTSDYMTAGTSSVKTKAIRSTAGRAGKSHGLQSRYKIHAQQMAAKGQDAKESDCPEGEKMVFGTCRKVQAGWGGGHG